MKKSSSFSWLVTTLLLLLGVASIASGVMRMSAMAEALSSGVIPQEPEGLISYVEHPILSTLHLMPGILFTLLGPLQLTPAIRLRWPAVHRWSGRVFIASGILIAISALIMAMLFPVVVNRFVTAANYIFGIALIISLIMAFRAIVQRDFACHRAWMIRAYAIGLSVATMRVIFFSLFFLLAEFKDAYIPPLVWCTFLTHLMVAELIVRGGRQRRPALEVA